MSPFPSAALACPSPARCWAAIILATTPPLATTSSLEAVIEGVRRAGAEVTDVIAVIEKGEGLKRLQGIYDDIRIQSLVRLVMDGDTVVLLEDERP